LPKEYLQTPRITLSNLSRSLSVLEFSVEQAGLVARSANQTGPLLFKEKPLEDRVNRLANRAKSHLSALKDEEAKGNLRRAILLRDLVDRALSKMSRLVVQALEPQWRLRGVVPATEEHTPVRLGEYFVAGRVVVFLHHVFLHLQSLVWFGMV